MLIKAPKKSPVLQFESTTGIHELRVTELSHLYGAAIQTARTVEGIKNPEESPSTISIYTQFREKIASHLNIPAATLDTEMIFLLALEMERQVEELKKTCIISDVSQS